MDEQDQYESLGLDESLEDERDLDQIMADRRAAEVELDARDIRTGVTGGARKLPQMLDQGNFFLFKRNSINFTSSPTIYACLSKKEVSNHPCTKSFYASKQNTSCWEEPTYNCSKIEGLFV